MLIMNAKDIASRLTLAQIEEIRSAKLSQMAEAKAGAEERARKAQEQAAKLAQEAAAFIGEASADIAAAGETNAAGEGLAQAITRPTFYAYNPPLKADGQPLKVGTKGFEAWARIEAEKAKAQFMEGVK